MFRFWEFIYIYMVGQINRGSNLGELIFNLTKRDDVKNIVEVGTWNGMGSTKCILDGLTNDKHLWSIELYPDMFEMARTNLKEHLTSNVTLLNGRIIEYDEVFWFDHSEIDLSIDGHARLWYEKDLQLLKESVNVLDKLPTTIDLLVLDGGEYTTYPEYIKLKDRSKVIVIDDTNILKCKRIRLELMNDNNFIMISDNQDDRNGYSVFEKR